MTKLDLKKSLRHLFDPPKGRFVEVVVPEMTYLKVDGTGDPNVSEAYRTAVQWLYSVSYTMKFASKRDLAKDYVVPPLEGLWCADDPADFVARRKDRWRWTMMIMVPDFLGQDHYAAALAKTRTKLGEPPDTLRLETLTEGLSLQTLHIGSYDEEGPILAHLHDELMPAEKLDFNGRHHEIYLSDPRKTPPGKLKTILRQPVKPVREAP